MLRGLTRADAEAVIEALDLEGKTRVAVRAEVAARVKWAGLGREGARLDFDPDAMFGFPEGARG